MVDSNQNNYFPDDEQEKLLSAANENSDFEASETLNSSEEWSSSEQNPSELNSSQLSSSESTFAANTAINKDQSAFQNEEESNFMMNNEDEVDREFAGLIDPEAIDNDFSPIRSVEKEQNDTEFAADLAAAPPAQIDDRADQDVNTRGQTFGWFGLALAIASMFIWPVVLAPAGAVLGFIAWTQGSRALGVWSMVLGLISFVAFLAIAPNYS